MHYKLYTLVDITHTNQYRNELGKEHLHYKEQNFNTVLQTLGLRSNIFYNHGPVQIEVSGKVVGFDFEEIVRIWRFDWYTERDNLYLKDQDPVAYLKNDFNLVPYIKNLDENMTQRFSVFVTDTENRNIVFYLNE